MTATIKRHPPPITRQMIARFFTMKSSYPICNFTRRPVSRHSKRIRGANAAGSEAERSRERLLDGIQDMRHRLRRIRPNHSKHNKSNKVLMLLAPHFSIGPQIIPAIRDAPCRKTGC